MIAARAARNPARAVPRRVHLYWGLLGGALAMVAVAFVLRAASKPEIHYRGTAVSLQVYVRSGIAIRVLHEGESLAAGTQLAFTYSLAEPQHLLLFGVDDGGTITAYFPHGNIAHGSLLEAGDQRLRAAIGVRAPVRLSA